MTWFDRFDHFYFLAYVLLTVRYLRNRRNPNFETRIHLSTGTRKPPTVQYSPYPVLSYLVKMKGQAAFPPQNPEAFSFLRVMTYFIYLYISHIEIGHGGVWCGV